MSAVRAATDVDRAAIAAMLARAFRHDPAMSWIYPDEADRVARLPRLFGLLYDEDAAGMRLTSEHGEAATLWQRPGAPVKPGPVAMIRAAWPMWRALGTSIGRALAVSDAMAARRPRTPHWYLHIAGCDPAHQGQGHGGRAIRAGLAAATGVPTYLETATEANVGLYRSLGFAIVDEWQVPRGGPHFWSMLRVHDA